MVHLPSIGRASLQASAKKNDMDVFSESSKNFLVKAVTKKDPRVDSRKVGAKCHLWKGFNNIRIIRLPIPRH